ncbi:MAG: tRNA (guanosine(46)-N7)-methyltransferase TrmB, partial [Candidatus Nomurabacteria bacterium]|nr:tRNA (guanosine(46)-N7)-methyltransferase TrmB [Candidatus Nomurabacteria bacterium]
NFDEIAEVLRRDDLVVMPSDTVYGIFASALSESAVKKLRKVRERDPKRGFVILIDSVEAIEKLLDLPTEIANRLRSIWRAKSPKSIILNANNLQYDWLKDTRGDEPTVCFRVPNDKNLRELLKTTGPLCAPSANLPSEPPAKNIAEARKYFGDKVSLYIDGGEVENRTASRIIRLGFDGTVEIVRDDGKNHPEDFVITRKRKLYKFARFDEFDTCFHFEDWLKKRDELLRQSLVVEVGAGSALFSTELARLNPHKLFIAVDIKGDRLYQGARQAKELGLSNIYFVRSDIHRINEIIQAGFASELWITFCDPWPPKSDARHRLTAPRFLNYYRELLSDNGVLNFKTDNAPLFEWSLEQLAENGWKNEFVTRDLHDSDAPDEAKIKTSYEKRFTAEGLKINYVRATKN